MFRRSRLNSKAHTTKLRLNGKQEGLEQLREFGQNLCMYAGLNRLRCNRIVLVLNELFANIHRHGYGDEGGRVDWISRWIEQEGHLYHLEITARDYAPVIEDISRCKGVCPKTLRDNPVAGGLGMGLIYAITERCEHKPLIDGNQWLLVFDVQEAQEKEDKKS